MGILGGLLIFLSLPLFIGYAISEPRKQAWLRLGFLLGGVGIVIVALGALAE